MGDYAKRLKRIFHAKRLGEFISKNALPFEAADWHTGDCKRFRVGTCTGLWRSTPESYDIISISNKEPGNGHLEDVFQWFEQSCRRDGKVLRVLELWNDKFKWHLIHKRGFVRIPGTDDLEKVFE